MIRPSIPQIAVDRPELFGDTIRFRLHVPKPLRKYFISDNSYVQYDGCVDLRNVNNSILVIPMVAMIAPIAWAVGIDIHIDELDTTYLQYLKKVKETYRSLYSNFSFQGNIHADTAVKNEFRGDRTATLFSAGVDSLTSYLRIKHEEPDVISVFGLPILTPFKEKFWINMWNDIRSIANMDEVAAFQVKTDMPRTINYELLERQFGFRWYSEVAYELLLLGLCAPLAPIRRITTVVIPSSRTPGFRGYSGSHPLLELDNQHSWADINVTHNGHELSRQQKLKYLCQSDNLPYLSHLRVCWDGSYRTNCGMCEKCMRTIAGLLLEGINPNRCNFETDLTTFKLIKERFHKGVVLLHEEQLLMWREIQNHISNHIDERIPGSREFLAWLREYDLSQYRANKVRQLVWSANRVFRNRQLSTPYASRKIKCYWYITLAKLKLL